ncbi:MAG: metallophosphoesterase family protein [Gammaproteobacteria bacterium]|nr:metallophosphoesterase family protein [Gammaproteobacteria bacterium]
MQDSEILKHLEERLGSAHARQRLEIETSHESHVFGGGRHFIHLENWYSAPSVIRAGLKLTGLYDRASRNALDIRLVENEVTLAGLPERLNGLRLLHLSDLHLDMSEEILHAIVERVRDVDYDVCVLTGDYRFRTHGSIDGTLRGMHRLRGSLKDPVYAVLGNHDSVTMLPEFESVGIRLLMNESQAIVHGGEHLYLAGIDDAHFFGVGDIDKAMAGVPDSAPAILLSHTPEIYREAASAGVRLLLCGHTHGGQLCLPGGHPVTLDSRIPRRLGRGAWREGAMQGYTSPGAGASIIGVRLNCPAEVTLHVLRC